MKPFPFLLFFILFWNYHLQAQDLTENIDQFLKNTYQEGIAPGFSVVMVEDNQVVFTKGYGVESVDSSRPFTPQTASAIGSLTKSFTALAVMQLVERGKVDLDTPLVRYLPQFQTANKEISQQITVRMLLNNTSGLVGKVTKSGQVNNQAIEQLLHSLKAQHLTNQVGRTYEYSNTAFSLAGLLISKISGISYPDYLKKYIFEPLEMNRTSTNPKDFDRLQVLYGHNMGKEKPLTAQPTEPSGEMIAAGSLLRSTATDLGHYLIALLNEGKYGNHQIIQQKSIEQMWDKEVAFPGLSYGEGGDGFNYYYGLGWMISEIDGRTIIHHGGSTGTMSSFTILDPEKKIAAAILVNLDYNFINPYRFKKLEHIMNNLLHLVEDEPLTDFAVPRNEDPTINNFELPPTQYARYVGDYFFKEGTPSAWFFNGLNIKIFETPDGQLETKVFKAKEVIAHFRLDFSNPALAIARYIGQPVPLQFKINPKGKVINLFYAGAVFYKADEHFYKNYTRTSIQASSLSLYLPYYWQVKKNEAAALFGIAPNGEHQLIIKQLSTASLPPKEFFQQEFPNGQLVQTGLLQRVEKAGQVWWEQSFLSRQEGIIVQHFVLKSKAEEGGVYVILSGQQEGVTKKVQELVEGVMLY